MGLYPCSWPSTRQISMLRSPMLAIRDPIHLLKPSSVELFRWNLIQRWYMWSRTYEREGSQDIVINGSTVLMPNYRYCLQLHICAVWWQNAPLIELPGGLPFCKLMTGFSHRKHKLGWGRKRRLFLASVRFRIVPELWNQEKTARIFSCIFKLSAFDLV